jgi:hypothetical protein
MCSSSDQVRVHLLRGRLTPLCVASRTAQDEYAARYLAQLGVAASPDAARLVHENAPVEAARISAAWKSRGWLSNTLFVSPHWAPPEGERRRAADALDAAVSASDAAVVRAAAEKAAAEAVAVAPRAARAAASAALATIDVPHALGGMEATFRDIIEKFVRPFCAAAGKGGAAAEEPSVLHAEQVEANLARMIREVRALAAAAALSTCVNLQRDLLFCRAQVKRPLEVTPKDVNVVQRDFAAMIPFSKLAAHITPEDEAEVCGCRACCSSSMARAAR